MAGSSRHRAEQCLTLELVEHVVGVGARNRDEPERDVAERLGEHAADPDHDARSELLVGVDAGDELARCR